MLTLYMSLWKPGNFNCTYLLRSMEKETATHSSVLAWRILGTGEPGGLPSMGSHRVGHDWSDLAAVVTYYIFYLSFFDQFLLKFFLLMARRILVPWPQTEPVCPAVEARSPNHRTIGVNLSYLMVFLSHWNTNTMRVPVASPATRMVFGTELAFN